GRLAAVHAGAARADDRPPQLPRARLGPARAVRRRPAGAAASARGEATGLLAPDHRPLPLLLPRRRGAQQQLLDLAVRARAGGRGLRPRPRALRPGRRPWPGAAAPGRRARGTLPRPLARPARPGRRARGASGPPRPVTARPWCAAARLARMTSRHARAGRSERDPPWHSPPSICARSPPIGARLYHWPCELAYTNDTIDALAEREMIERVLVVDDEELVRSFVTAVLDGG